MKKIWLRLNGDEKFGYVVLTFFLWFSIIVFTENVEIWDNSTIAMLLHYDKNDFISPLKWINIIPAAYIIIALNIFFQVLITGKCPSLIKKYKIFELSELLHMSLISLLIIVIPFAMECIIVQILIIVFLYFVNKYLRIFGEFMNMRFETALEDCEDSKRNIK